MDRRSLPVVSWFICLALFGVGFRISWICGNVGGVDASLVSYQEVKDRADGLCSDLVLPYNHYGCEEFSARTSDGFLVGIQRMWRSELTRSEDHGHGRPPVLLFHGVFTGGDVWVINPPGEGLGFILADQGYDVWIANYRATKFSYGHINYTSNDKEFWNWSVDELASQDLSASLQLVSARAQQKVLLVAYSEGAQAVLAALSRGGSVGLISKVALLAPVSYITSGPQFVYMCSQIRIQKLFEALDIHKLSTSGPGGKQLVDLLCQASSMKCYKDWFQLFAGYSCCFNTTRRPYIDKYETQPTSVQNLAHFSQQITKQTFAMFDYGAQGNMERYQREMPPAYDMSHYPSQHVPTLVVSGQKDAFANARDVSHLLREMPASPKLHTLVVPNFGHLDFVFGYNANTLVYNHILAFFQA